MLQNLTGWHALLLLAVVVLIFGAAKLPALARSVGQSMRILKQEAELDRLPEPETTAVSTVAVPAPGTPDEAVERPADSPAAPDAAGVPVWPDALSSPETLARIRPGQRFIVIGDSAHPTRFALDALPDDHPARRAAEARTDDVRGLSGADEPRWARAEVRSQPA